MADISIGETLDISREKKGGYMIGHAPVSVKKQQMEKIDRLIRGEDQGHA